MKRNCLLVIAGIFILAGCQVTVDQEELSLPQTSGTYEYVTPSVSQQLSYSEESEIFTVDASTKSVTITGDLSGKTVYYAQVNVSEAELADEFVRYISGDAEQSSRTAVSSEETTKIPHNHDEESEARCYHGYAFQPEFETASGSRTASVLERNVTRFLIRLASQKSRFQLPPQRIHMKNRPQHFTLSIQLAMFGFWTKTNSSLKIHKNQKSQKNMRSDLKLSTRS